jgi:hypothetical protein
VPSTSEAIDDQKPRTEKEKEEAPKENQDKEKEWGKTRDKYLAAGATSFI